MEAYALRLGPADHSLGPPHHRHRLDRRVVLLRLPRQQPAAAKRKEDADEGVGGELWAIHGGGFYHAQKFRVAPAQLPEPLHWFKWEAYWTWMSGFALFIVMYYAHAELYMIDRSVADIAPWQAIAISVALLVAGWVFYDQLCKRAGLEREKLVAIVMIVFFTAVAWGLSYVYSGRAMYLQIGAMIGTIMAWNVYFVIMPSQRKLVEAKERGVAPDPVYGLRGKQRSVHNNYFTLPVLFIMISNHYPLTFGHKHAWLVLLAVGLLAAYVRHFFNLRHKGKTVWAIPVSAALATLLLAVAIAPAKPKPAAYTFAEVQKIVAERCATCHAAKPTQPGFNESAQGLPARHAAAHRSGRAEDLRADRGEQGDADRQSHQHDRRRARDARRVGCGGRAGEVEYRSV